MLNNYVTNATAIAKNNKNPEFLIIEPQKVACQRIRKNNLGFI